MIYISDFLFKSLLTHHLFVTAISNMPVRPSISPLPLDNHLMLIHKKLPVSPLHMQEIEFLFQKGSLAVPERTWTS